MQPLLLRSKQSGFTIVEILVALVIGFATVFAALSATSEAIRSKVNSDRRQTLANDFNLIGNYFARNIPAGAGAGLSAASSYWIENECGVRSDYPDCEGADRLTIATATGPQACSITNYNPVTHVANLSESGLPCCLLNQNMLHRYVMVALDDSWVQKWVNTQNLSACTVGLRPGPMSPHDNAAPGFNFSGGIIVPISIRTYYTNPSTHTLYISDFGDSALSQSQQVGQVTPLGDRVLDFQVALGFDFKPRDGQILDTKSNTDEWLYNSPTLPRESRSDSNFAAAFDFSLHMVAIGLALSVPMTPSVTVKELQLFDGPIRTEPSSGLQSSVMKFGIRSKSTFD